MRAIKDFSRLTAIHAPPCLHKSMYRSALICIRNPSCIGWSSLSQVNDRPREPAAVIRADFARALEYFLSHLCIFLPLPDPGARIERRAWGMRIPAPFTLRMPYEPCVPTSPTGGTPAPLRSGAIAHHGIQPHPSPPRRFLVENAGVDCNMSARRRHPVVLGPGASLNALATMILWQRTTLPPRAARPIVPMTPA